ncbi:MAG TPA: nitroreductase family deazaflavin-dependent oxidoreductase [Candidatus Dormibacteraeota bacterium]
MSERSYRRPTWFRVHFWDPLARFMIQRGMAPGGGSQDGSGMRVLEVHGRKTGQVYRRPVAIAAVDGRRYIVSLWGESQWARNLRAGTEARLQVGRRAEPIDAHEVDAGDEKADLMLAVSRQYPFFARGYFKVDPRKVTLEQARELAARYPVFRIETAGRRPSE